MPLYWHSLYSTKVTTSCTPFSLSPITMLLKGMPHTLLYSCAFLYIEYTGLFFCCTFCSLVICIVCFFCFLFSTLIFGHFYFLYPISQHQKYLTSFFSSVYWYLIHLSSLLLLITLLDNTSNLFWEINCPFVTNFIQTYLY